MKKEEAYQIQRGDYFLYHGETVKVTGRSPYNENNYNVVNKNGSKFYAEVDELEPIILNEYVLKQADARKVVHVLINTANDIALKHKVNNHYRFEVRRR